ncbi:MAG TPA: hypothetical protein VGY75_12165 [Candidatus Udaeobacter sp.]|nr:hypothetical protein [Candidatus Udaeobacter sp.]
MPVSHFGQKFRSCSHDAVIRVYDEAGKVIETHEEAGDFGVTDYSELFAVQAWSIQ